jgi:ketosteroid isomerase-like protein
MAVGADVARRYVELLRAEDLGGLLQLFAPDARLNSDIACYEGRDQIGKFYRDVSFAGKARPEVVRIMEEGDVTMMEVAATSVFLRADQIAHAVDVFHFGPDGLIVQLDIYIR